MNDLYRRLSARMELGLPGFDAQAKMTPPGRLPADRALLMLDKEPYKGAVMAILNPQPGGTWSLIYIKRPDYDGTHGGQMAFPGGKADLEDENIVATAKRETWEEIGVTDDNYELIGPLTTVFIPPSNFLVYPFLAMAKHTLSFQQDEREVEYIWQVPVLELILEKSVSVSDFKTAYGTIKNYPCYVFGNHIIWGATAMITAEIRALLQDVEELR